jgi:hypothetical protein
MKKVIAVAMSTLLASPYVYGMKRVRPQGNEYEDLQQVEYLSKSTPSEFYSEVRKELIFCGFQRLMKLEESMLSVNLAHFRNMYVHHGVILDGTNGLLLQQYIIAWHENRQREKKLGGPHMYIINGQISFR